MIINFTVKNFRSIKNEQTLSLYEPKGLKTVVPTSYTGGEIPLLKTTLIFGPNASGKSNILKALSMLSYFVRISDRLQLDEIIPLYEPFRLDIKTRTEPVEFGIEFITDNTRYEYYTQFYEKEILRETLHLYSEHNKRALLFDRMKSTIKYGTSLKGEKKVIENSLLKNNLFLSRAANSNFEQLFPVYRFLTQQLGFEMEIMPKDDFYPNNTTRGFNKGDEKFEKAVLGFLNAADLNIERIKIEIDESFLEEFQSNKKIPDNIRLRLIHDMAGRPKIGHPILLENKFHDLVYFDLFKDESSGTKKMYDLAGRILQTLKKGSVLILDEFDGGLHHELSRYIVRLFSDKKSNPLGAQLIAATHDTKLMEELTRPQIWFTQKKYTGESELFCLDEFDKDKIRKDGPFVKWYFEGRFDALPNIDYKKFIDTLD
ncbi:AAA family ATPase [Leptospira sarikeiensis]|uniref:ATPase AAA-type core domain-containing protein n=1 Tax=Leptospira sarikeiensis TaxID=2484943 RepID=A0A4R9KCL1_9LEPT|nr:ATP-binding protein [Leptospira sarikeiensis]TGL64683.1 hypothetical protein EHQ64_02205 [Leptospira sarikeiensis]